MSEQAKKFRDQKDTHERELAKVAKELADSQTALRTAEQELQTLRTPAARKGFLDDL